MIITIPCHICATPVPINECHIHRQRFLFCSKVCRQTPCVPIICSICGNTFLARAQQAGHARFCSRPCFLTFSRQEQLHKKHGQVERFCKQCGATFRVRTSTAKVQIYCSRACSGIAGGIKLANRKSTKVTLKCEYCGKRYKTFPSRSKSRFCCSDHARIGNLMRLAKNPRTGIEKIMAQALSQAGYLYREQVPMFGKFLVDFVLPAHAIVVQCDGMYWHDRPKIQGRDKGQDRYLAKAGFHVVRFTDIEINSDIDACIRHITALVGD